MTTPIQMPARAGKLIPYANDLTPASNDLDLQVKIATTTGWLDLDDPLAGYTVHGDSFATRTVSYRTRAVSNEFIEGSFAVTSVRENVNEVLAVRVSGNTTYEFRNRVQKLTDALEQLSYQIMMRIEDATEYWTCQPAGYAIETQREFYHARIGVVRATVPRLPAVILVQATGDET